MNDILNKINNQTDFSAKSLENLIHELGLNNENLEEQPPELSAFFGKGLKMWQYPNQLSKFAEFIHQLSIDSYLEIGCRWGGTFIFINEILRRNTPSLKSYACDLINKSQLLQEYSSFREFEYLENPSTHLSKYFREIKPTMVFIDGDHTYNGVKNDYLIFEDIPETKYLIFHDIANDNCPGVVAFWNEIKNNKNYDSIEFIEQYQSVRGSFLGFGVLIRK